MIRNLYLFLLILLPALQGCSSDNQLPPQASSKVAKVDILIHSGQVFNSKSKRLEPMDLAVCGTIICDIYPRGSKQIRAKRRIDAKGKVVSPGFIDPHTHALVELKSHDNNHNLNYLTQGVTTVIIGNDGDGSADIDKLSKELLANGIGTHVGMLVGHGAVRQQVMGKAKRMPTSKELNAMESLVEQAMAQGALGFSSGLYYVPQNYASTEEVIALAKVAARYHGIYDTHLRDESSFSIGLLPAVDEAIAIATQANVHLHLAHLKALGVDVWGQSGAVIDKVEQAQSQGISISADQYPWLASGTKLDNAIMPKWVMADSQNAFFKRLNDPALYQQLNREITENLRRRGGGKALLITAFDEQQLIGKTLEQIAIALDKSEVDAAIELVQRGEVRVASFNMLEQDLANFIVKPWVVTSSDGTDGHPRKYASFPQKYQEYVKQNSLLTLEEFIYQSSTKTAEILGLSKRGLLGVGMFADIVILDTENYRAQADFSHWERYSKGVEAVLINGQLAIDKQQYTGALAGQVLKQ
ncbi:N-acyl-D-amino-acid deacylase family protein [Shewanella woodyi]|uniref:N-acyl-D-amino-acid deacylase n=1 Tax=Shewanella woodyi (strain ATCC 51908 / MS32) TaxID=392500 RepID=B1KNR4_SHEWM|nr:amidohydrolase family protein [Shewanella woodyi]ACA87522.1 N-acyl-D-amino-acid deacylase [Shewanella woodyi ATCC 51908]